MHEHLKEFIYFLVFFIAKTRFYGIFRENSKKLTGFLAVLSIESCFLIEFRYFAGLKSKSHVGNPLVCFLGLLAEKQIKFIDQIHKKQIKSN